MYDRGYSHKSATRNQLFFTNFVMLPPFETSKII